MKTKQSGRGGARLGAGRKKSSQFRTVTMKVPTPIANIVSSYAEQHGITQVAAFADIWENDYEPKKEIITPIELADMKGKLERLEKENKKFQIIQSILAEWKTKIETGKGPRWYHINKFWKILIKVFD